MEGSQVFSLEHSLQLTNSTGKIIPTSTAMLHTPRCHSADQVAWQSMRYAIAAEMLNGDGGGSSGRGSGELGGHEVSSI